MATRDSGPRTWNPSGPFDTPGVRIRLARATDLASVCRLERSCFSDPWSEGSFRALIGDPLVYFAVAEADRGDLAGYVVAWCVGDEAELANLAVAPEARRRRVGAALLRAALAIAADRGVSTMYLEVRESNSAARELYETRGFEVIGRRRRYYRFPPEDALVMRRAVKGSPVEGV